MTNPSLWGPPFWQMLFACAWHCDASHFEDLKQLILHQMPLLLPCEKCQNHYTKHLPVVKRKAKGEPKTVEQMFKWLWYLKDQVNKSLRPPVPSITLDDLTARHLFHGGMVDDVALGDSLVLVALEASRTGVARDDLVLTVCHTLAKLLPLPDDSHVLQSLQRMKRPVRPATFHLAKCARIARGLPVLPLRHYSYISDEEE